MSKIDGKWFNKGVDYAVETLEKSFDDLIRITED